MQRHPRPEPAAIPLPAFAGTDAADAPAPGPATVERAMELLAGVPDPDIPTLGLVDLGVIRGVTVDAGGRATVRMSPTYTGCPATDLMKLMAIDRLLQGGFSSVHVALELSPPWSSDDITADGLRKLREAGIAPPEYRTTDKRHLTGEVQSVACPRCGGRHTRLLSAFGSTACKALWRCETCAEPFDHFKCI
ncbi:MAG: 1,2-phenylacetyl-CoA epoxidase subunit PaaD [Pseudomonadota bacterium]|nr:1,2-phenylacetyl-CoA epoxidase subunit PaaD [Pseudomonadota bacterium]